MISWAVPAMQLRHIRVRQVYCVRWMVAVPVDNQYATGTDEDAPTDDLVSQLTAENQRLCANLANAHQSERR